jgi:cytochrome c oxidase subunit 4
MTAPSESTNHEAAPAGHGEQLAHILPVPLLLGVFVALVILTVATVAATWVDLGRWNLHLAMTIAMVKGTLVALYFMHLRYDKPFHALIFITALVFLALFLSGTLVDTLQYQPDIRNYEEAVQ